MHDCGGSVLGQCNSPPRGRHTHRYRSDLLQVIHPIRVCQHTHPVRTETVFKKMTWPGHLNMFFSLNPKYEYLCRAPPPHLYLPSKSPL